MIFARWGQNWGVIAYVYVVFVSLFFPCLGQALFNPLKSRTTYPAPIVVQPSQNWDGNDGPWSSFPIQIGSPPQTVKVLISTVSSETWVIATEGCTAEDPPDCQKQRGELFNYNQSTSYTPNTANLTSSIYPLGLESSLGYSGRGRYGFDDITFGWLGSGGLTLKNQTIAGVATKSFFMGLFGLTPRSTNFTNFNHPIPSFMQNLANQSMIPSLSWAYSAGNQYQPGSSDGTLTLGGYDSSRFIPNNVTFPLSELDDLFVQVLSITTNNSVSLLSSPITSVLDSTTPYIYLPVSACTLFEAAFGLIWDTNSSLYLINDTQHTVLSTQNPTITLQLSPSESNGTVDITLPYAAFDLTASAPLVANTSRYFPLKRADNDTQYVIGRTFFQEAYVIADYERKNFSVSQCKWDNLAQAIIPILPPSNSTTSSSNKAISLPIGALAGIIAGGVVVLIVGAILFYVFYFKPRRQRKAAAELAANERQPEIILKPELDGSAPADPRQEIFETEGKKIIPVEMADGAMQPIYELPAQEEVAAEMTGLSQAGELDGRSRRIKPKRFSWERQTNSEPTSPGTESETLSPGSVSSAGMVSPVSPAPWGRGFVRRSRGRDSDSTIVVSPESAGWGPSWSPGSAPSVMITPATPIQGRGRPPYPI